MAVNYHQLYNDSKTFVDMPMKYDPEYVLEKFNEEFASVAVEDMNRTRLRMFIDTYFRGSCIGCDTLTSFIIIAVVFICWAFTDRCKHKQTLQIFKEELAAIKSLRPVINNSPAGSEMLSCTPPDWNPQPEKLMSIVDPQLRQWALKLNEIWRSLYGELTQPKIDEHHCTVREERGDEHTGTFEYILDGHFIESYKISIFEKDSNNETEQTSSSAVNSIEIDPAIENKSSRYSLIYLPHIFIIPGGRFREFYYWDAYWIIKKSATFQVLRFGFVPNGGRVYYLQRSQPPLLSGMLYEYYEVTGDKKFLRKMLPILEKEFMFWQSNRMVNISIDGANYLVYRYKARSNMPRPESFTVDMKKAESIEEKAQFWQVYYYLIYLNIVRGYREQKNTLIFKQTHKKYMVFDSRTIFHDQVKSEFYRELRAQFRNTVHKVFYNHTARSWFDYNLRTKSHNTMFYPSITVPLFTGCYNSLNQGKSERLFSLMKNLGVFKYPGGIPTSMIADSKEQWDFPNGFSPLNHMIVEGLRKSHNAHMQDAAFRLASKWILGNYKVWKETNHMWEKAFRLASKWILGNYKVWKETNHMWEKYNVIGHYPKPGSGGEYDVQDGFGWTNGALLDLLVTYNDRLRL
ncbi:alpha,alpha-trehalase [Dictyocaulus viviparus]|uniref:Trehalase n=1 Tax=Dictyocaulus viviparus TaxID=29172 RepID=A0A0D8Y834_DICVI|nr:alpha,alpha-trehalase [Dictyocaulus viviparus]